MNKTWKGFTISIILCLFSVFVFNSMGSNIENSVIQRNTYYETSSELIYNINKQKYLSKEEKDKYITEIQNTDNFTKQVKSLRKAEDHNFKKQLDIEYSNRSNTFHIFYNIFAFTLFLSTVFTLIYTYKVIKEWREEE